MEARPCGEILGSETLSMCSRTVACWPWLQGASSRARGDRSVWTLRQSTIRGAEMPQFALFIKLYRVLGYLW